MRLAPPDKKDLLARLVAIGYSEKEGTYLLRVARKEEELERFLAARQDLAALGAQAGQTVHKATRESLITALLAADPILRYEGTLVLLDRLVKGDVELAVAGARILAQAGRKKVATFLEGLHGIAFAGVRASLSLTTPCHHVALAALAGRGKPEALLRFCQKVERAQQAVEGYVPSEAVLFSLFLSAGRLNG